MRTFWIVVVVAVLAGGAWLFLPAGGSGMDASDTAVTPEPATPAWPEAEESAADAVVPAEPEAIEPEVDEPAVTAPAVTAPIESAAEEAAAEAETVVEEVEQTALSAVESAEEVVDDSSAAASDAVAAGGFGSLMFTPETVAASDRSADAASDPEAVEDAAAALAGLIETIRSGASAAVDGLSNVGGDDVASSEAADGGDMDAALAAIVEEREAQAGEVAEAPAEPEVALDAVSDHPEGGLEIGGRWRVPGSGTETDPYVLRWDVLQSAMQIYNPRIGKTEPPAWSSALEGKWVAIEGYVVLPLAQQSSKEILLTLNQWDGCCIGVPPTPYDAIEVTLVEAIDGNAAIGAFYYGRLEGKFSVDPYLAGGWLLGLYLMEDAKLKNFGQK